MNKPRLLKANEIDVRVGTINEKGATLLFYKDARVDMNILDEMDVKWKRSHELINGNLFCTISIWDDEIKEWISRQDVGVESQSEKEKGQASDAFKRAAFNFGIGRELYTAPFTWISADKYNGFINGKTPQGKDRYATYDKFEVKSIQYNDNREIIGINVINTKTNRVVFTLGDDKKSVGTREDGHEEEVKVMLKYRKQKIQEKLKEHEYTRADQMAVFINGVLKKNTIDTLEEADLVEDALNNEE